MIDAELDTLEAAAKAATKGPWIDIEEDDENFGWGIHYTTTQNRLDNSKAGIAKIETDFNPPVEKEQKANAAFIAAANPAVVLELIAELRQARAERDWLASELSMQCPEHRGSQVWLNIARRVVCQKIAKEATCKKS